MLSRRTLHGACVALLALGACKEGTENQAGDFLPVVPLPDGTQGCFATDVPGTITQVHQSAAFGPLSQIAAVRGAEEFYYTGEDGAIRHLSLTGGLPVDTVLVAAGQIEASYLQPGLDGPAVLSGIAVFDAQFLVVAEHASNTLLLVDRGAQNDFQNLAGAKFDTGGFANGSGAEIRFNFTEPVPLLAALGDVVYVGDTENHAVRVVDVVGVPAAETVAGTGAPGDAVGLLTTVQFDTPSGFAATCPGELLVVESGAAGVAGNRLVSLRIGGPSFFGGFDGTATVLAGDGTPATTQGVDDAAQLNSPVGLVATLDGFAYWIDVDHVNARGILRRYDVSTGTSDCPLFPNCADAVASLGSFAGERFSLAVGDSGALYVLEADTETLFRVDP